MSGTDGAKLGEAVTALALAGLHEPLVGTGGGWHGWRSGEFTVMENSVSGVEQPTIRSSGSHAAMASGMARQRDEENVRA